MHSGGRLSQCYILHTESAWAPQARGSGKGSLRRCLVVRRCPLPHPHGPSSVTGGLGWRQRPTASQTEMVYSLDVSCQGASRAPFMSAETLRRARGMRSTSRFAPDCASSREIASASSDAMAEGGDRKMVSERRPERRRSLRDVEMATSGGQVRTSFDRTFWGGSQMAPNSVIFLLHGRFGGFSRLQRWH